ncbi:MAG: PAS sensor histidine kinase [Halonotius sp. J07HN4]|nr:MAG: PAS sensor histidine kinase [Halonotius sp. J07HN4]
MTDDSAAHSGEPAAEAVLDRVDDAVYALDSEWRFTFLNEQAAALLAVDPDKVLGQTLWETFPETTEGRVGEEFRAAMDAGEASRFDIYYEPLDRWFSVRAYPDDDGLTVLFHDLAAEEGRDLDLQRKQLLFEAIFEQTEDALIVADSDRHITDLNPAAESVFGYETDSVAGQPVAMLYGEPIDENGSDTAPRSGEQPYVLTYERADGTTFEGETFSTTLTGPDGQALATLASIRDVSSRIAYERRIEAKNDALRRFHTITTDKERSFEATVESMLDLGVDYLDVDIGVFASVDDDTYAVEVAAPEDGPITAGDSFDLAETYCERVIDAGEPVAFTTGTADTVTTGAYGTDGFQTYLGVPVVVNDATYGTLCFAARDGRAEPFTDGDTAFVQIAAQWLGSELANNAFEAKLTALNETARQLMGAESRGEIAEITTQRAAAVLDLPLTGIWWYDESVDALVPATQTAATTELIGDQPTFRPDDAIAWDVYAEGEARVYGDINDAGQLHNEETVFGSEVLVPLGDHGVMIVGSTEPHAFAETDRTLIDVLAATVTAALNRAEREAVLRETRAELEATNEELALLNRVVRHDIKNDVAVISGHTQTLVDRLDDDDAAALQPVLRAATHITDITNTVGEFLDVLGGDSDPELEPIDLTAVVTDECRNVRSRYENAVITVDDGFPTGIEVAATELLSSVFQNLLTNAVTHNDKHPPEVTVSGADHGDSVVVHVADNGPGIPEDRREEIFGRGEQGLESPGSGIGLYLVDTLMTLFGGTIEITDNEPEGSVFTLTLPKADATL